MTTPATQINGLLVPMGEDQAIPAFDDVPLAASSVPLVAKLQYVMADPTTGLATLADDATPGQICMGYQRVDELSTSSTTAGAARARVAQGFAQHLAPSTIANDAPGAANIATPIFAADANTPGLLSHTGTVAGANLKNRSLLGISYGLVKQGGVAIKHYVGPIASAIARSLLIANAFPLASIGISDAAANAATAERSIRRPKIHGTVTDITFTGAAVAADNTDYVTITISKRDGAGGGATVMGTYDSRAANQGAVTAFVPAAFSLSAVAGALDLLESDIVTITVVKPGAGKTLTGEILVNGKVI